ncbi:hypothetical protein GF386_01080, partial [Candidatus Pacearchaeota archaeon]|nr:hypothetical protein [Candidatus Pacearchaeota archaeon]MBD3282825.1 hypothetical protein [Candidatus Pacearchaeota archaeon]
MNKLGFFRSIDFTEYESKAIVSLLKLGAATPKQIYIDSQVPQNKLYNILRKFTGLGIISQIPSEPKKYKLANLETLIENKIKQKEDLLRSLKENSKKIKQNLDTGFIFSLIKSQQAIMDQLAENNPKVKKEIFGVQGRWRLWAKGLRQLQVSVKKGVDVRIIGVIDDETKKRAIEWKKIGCKIRYWNRKFGEFPPRFTVFDNKQARITFGRPEIKDSK